ncbi:MAG: acetoin utilization protein AcuC [Bacteroidetes bacterium SW_9_63_38]|nr:MAG: acetoin utilization protein AcuC [Bacteroidetes bacterium SW_9_63_38]
MATLLFHDRYLDYDFGPEHPFSPVRQQMVVSLLDALGHPVDAASPPVASRGHVRRVHSDQFVRTVEAASDDGTAPAQAWDYGLDTGDVPVFAGMDTATRGLVGGTLHGATLIAEGTAHRVLQLGGGLHHAHRDRASGFCVYNDLSIAIDQLRNSGHRVAYIDIDVHHGDGVQALHYDDPGVLTISLHESGRYLFPGSGAVEEIGADAGEGSSLNVPLAPHTGPDSYREVFDRVVPYALKQFDPDVMVAQCGADAHFKDPLADLLLTSQTYEYLFQQLLTLADEHTCGRLLCTLGGGYHLDAVSRIWTLLALVVHDHERPSALPEAWRERWQDQISDPLPSTLHDPEPSFDVTRRSAITENNRQTSKQVLELMAPHWY